MYVYRERESERERVPSWTGAQTTADVLCNLQDYNPDLTHNISKRSRKGADGIMLTHVTAPVDHAQTGERVR